MHVPLIICAFSGAGVMVVASLFLSIGLNSTRYIIYILSGGADDVAWTYVHCELLLHCVCFKTTGLSYHACVIEFNRHPVWDKVYIQHCQYVHVHLVPCFMHCLYWKCMTFFSFPNHWPNVPLFVLCTFIAGELLSCPMFRVCDFIEKCMYFYSFPIHIDLMFHLLYYVHSQLRGVSCCLVPCLSMCLC
jgi:hypothetical protein